MSGENSMSKRIFIYILTSVLITPFIVHNVFAGEEKEYRVYQYIIQSARGEFTEISRTLENGLQTAGWQVVAKVNAGAPEKCQYRAQVFVLYDSVYALQIMEANPKTGPFAVVDRVNLFEDENGIHVSVVNPHSINRTILMDDTSFEEITETHLQALRTAIIGSVDGTASDMEYGQKRKKGYIGKTMGVMAGGKFEDKLKDEASIADSDVQTVAAKVRWK
jgi:hypothetical protein